MTSIDTLTIMAGDTAQPLPYRKELVAVGKVTYGGPVQIHASPTLRTDPYAYGVWLATTGTGECLVLSGWAGHDEMIACLTGYLSMPMRNPAQYAQAAQLLATLQHC